MDKNYAVLNEDNIVMCVMTTNETISESNFIEIPVHDVYLPDCSYSKSTKVFTESIDRIRQGYSPILDK